MRMRTAATLLLSTLAFSTVSSPCFAGSPTHRVLASLNEVSLRVSGPLTLPSAVGSDPKALNQEVQELVDERLRAAKLATTGDSDSKLYFVITCSDDRKFPNELALLVRLELIEPATVERLSGATAPPRPLGVVSWRTHRMELVEAVQFRMRMMELVTEVLTEFIEDVEAAAQLASGKTGG